jgi:hypothetical protein
MTKIITDPENYTREDLRNLDWDMVRLNVTIDIEPMLEWFNQVKISTPESLFLFSQKDLFESHLLDNPRMNGICVGDAGFWALQWPVQRCDAIPTPFFCNKEKFPEMLDETWEDKMDNHLDQYYFGAYKNMVETLGQDAWTWGRAMNCGKECGIGPHRDHDGIDLESHMIRLHVNLQTNEDSTWHFFSQLGETPADTWQYERSAYNPKPGEVYLVNVSNVHAPVNHGDEEWILLHSDPSDDAIDRLLKSEIRITYNG